MLRSPSGSDLLVIENILREQSKTGKFQSEDVLNVVLSMGFEGARFYDVAFNQPSNDNLLVLTNYLGAAAPNNILGYKIHFRDATLSKSTSEMSPAISQDSHVLTVAQRKWANDLALKGKNWIDVPVAKDSTLIGVLAADWSGDRTLLTEEVSNGLMVIANIIGHYTQYTGDVAIKSFLDAFESTVQPRSTDRAPDERMTKVLGFVRDAMDAQLAAMFEYDWKQDTLKKIAEDYHPNIFPRKFDEVYRAGKYLTGLAWADGKYRHIPDFQDVLSLQNFNVESTSLTRHSALLGKLNTVLYYKIETKFKGYLIRLMNRADNIDLSFNNIHVHILRSVGKKIEDTFNDLGVEVQLRELQQVSNSILKNVTKAKLGLRECLDALGSEGFDNLGVICSSDGANGFDYVSFSSLRYENFLLENRHDTTHDRFFGQVLKWNEIRETNITDLKEYNDQNHLLNLYREDGVGTLISVPIVSSLVHGVLLIPLKLDDQSKPIFGAVDRLSDQQRNSLNAYAALIGICIEAASSHISAENAVHLVGQIGHEMESPISILGQNGIGAVNLAIQSITRVADLSQNVDDVTPKKKQAELINMKSELINMKSTLNREMHNINSLMGVAMAMTKMSEGQLSLYFREYALSELLHTAWKEVKKWALFLDHRGVQRDLVLKVNEACSRITAVGDEDILKTAFVNLFKNAAKYSLPRYRGKPMEINVFGQPQIGEFVVQIKNWGVEIPEERREEIFKRFYRYDRTDRLRAVRGMGLGLYIARTFFAAHRGRIFCSASEFTLDDPKRKKQGEGFFTTFEVHLPTTLQSGPHIYKWEV